MKILMIDKYYFIKGGAERYYFELGKILESKGHEVIPFAMKHPDNFNTKYEPDFVSNIEFNGLSKIQKLKYAPKIFGRIIYSFEAKNSLRKLIEKEQPDIAHLHMIDHQLSPSILHTLRGCGIPIIQTCHQYKLICPSYRMFIMHKNQICEKCISGGFYNAVVQKCHKASITASSIVALESYIHKWMKIYDLIDLFHVPSQFLGNKLIEGGFPKEKIWHHFYTIDMKDYPYHPESSDYCVYYGRLSGEKGILTLLKAMTKLPKVKLYIIGDGPQRIELEEFSEANLLSNIKFLGNQAKKDIVRLVQNAKFVIVPSEWYDNSPLVIYESFAMGKPVIASTMGGMSELIDDAINGLLFSAGNIKELTSCINKLWINPKVCNRMGKNAHNKALSEFSPEVHYEQIIDVYHNLLNWKDKKNYPNKISVLN